jgi:transposase
MAIPFKRRKKAVELYLSGTLSLRDAASRLGIHYNTLYRWIALYRKEGFDGLSRRKRYRRPSNRASTELENAVISLKERNPSITLHAAQSRLAGMGYAVSMKGVWGIWKRFGYAGFNRERFSTNFPDFISIAKETSHEIERAKEFARAGDLRRAREILNDLPSCLNAEVLQELPDNALSLKRRLEKLTYSFGTMPYAPYRVRMRRLRQEFLKKGYHYSALWAGIREVFTLEWLGKPKEQLALINELLLLLGPRRSCLTTSQRFALRASEFIACIRLMKIEMAFRALHECKRISRVFPSISFLLDLATLYSYIGYYREMGMLLEKLLRFVDEEKARSLLINLAYAKGNEADYRMSLRLLRKSRVEGDPIALFVRAHCALGQGRIEKAKVMAQKGLQRAQEQAILGYVSTGSLILAEIHAAIRETKRSRLLLMQHIGLLRNLGMDVSVLSREIILARSTIPEGADRIRTIKLALLLRTAADTGSTTDYRRAHRFAERYRLLGVLHRLVLLMPEPVLGVIAKGKDTGLPRTLLNLPVFKKEIPVYVVKFLGHLVVYRDQRYLRVKLSPKDTSFLIFFAFSERRKIPLEKIYANYWPSSKQPARNLSHLLVRLRKALKIPSHFLYVKENTLFIDCYFTTDYEQYLEHLAQAKILQRGGRWKLARGEYGRAFSIFRDEPFKKMYDDWSDDKRIEILFNLEKEASAYIKELFDRGNRREARRFMKRIAKIVPLIKDM